MKQEYPILKELVIPSFGKKILEKDPNNPSLLLGNDTFSLLMERIEIYKDRMRQRKRQKQPIENDPMNLSKEELIVQYFKDLKRQFREEHGTSTSDQSMGISHLHDAQDPNEDHDLNIEIITEILKENKDKSLR